MKKILLLPVLLMLWTQVQAQSTYPFAEDNKIWSVMNHSWGTTWTHYQKLQGDTLIGAYLYKKVYYSGDSAQSIWGLENLYIREDSNGKVYRLQTGTEALIYDFSLQSGDSILTSGPLGYAKVDSVDSVLIDGSMRKRIFFESWWAETWIEGLGSSQHPFNPFINLWLADLGYEVLCVSDTGGLIYKLPGYDDCYYTYGISVNELTRDHSQLTVYPQPACDYIWLELPIPVNEPWTYEITNIHGSRLSTGSFEGQRLKIQTTAFPPGFYFIRVNTGDQRCAARFSVIR